MNEDTELVLAALSGCRLGRTGYLRGECPLCIIREGTRDTKTSLGLHIPTRWWSCFRCRARGRVSEAAAAGLGGVTPGFSRFGGPAQPESAQQAAHARSGAAGEPEEPPEALSPPPGWLELGAGAGAGAVSTRPHREYLAHRGVPSQVVREARVGCCLSGRWAGRVLVPILGMGGAWQGWSGRALTSRVLPRYRYPDGMHRATMLWNAAALHIVTDTPLLVVEGVFDGLRHWPNAVAVLGKPSRLQLPLLCSAARPIVVALDGDAWRDGEALAWQLQLAGVRAKALKLAPRTDPGDLANEVLAAQARALWSAA